MKKTKIVCTIGPASEQKESLRKLIGEAGMNVMRMNFSHGDYEEQGFRIKNVKELNAENNWHVGMMLDTKGPEIRTGYLENDEPVMLHKGDIIRVTMDYSYLGNKDKVAISYSGLYDDIHVGGQILIEDGNLTFTVIEKDEANKELVCRVENDRKLKNKRNCNVPGVILNMDYISPKDKADIEFACDQDLDFIAASFVRRPQDIKDIRNILAAKGYTPSTTSNRMDAAGDASLAKVIETIETVDTETYSTSRTNQEIHNLFEDSDLNKNEYTKETSPVEYITRSDWNGTVVLDPLDNNTNYTKITMTADLLADFRAGWDGSMLEQDDVKYPTYGVNAGISLAAMMQDTNGNEISYDDPLWDEFMDQLTWDDTVALLSEGMRMTAALPSVNKPATVDHNGPLGPTQPYTDGSQPSTFPSTAVLASTFNPALVDEVGELYGENALHCGYAGLYGPAVNLHRSQYSSRNNEYYSEDSFLSGYTAGRQIKAIQENGVYCYIKHFVLNDQETNRYGLSTWLNEQSFRELYLDAFDITIEVGDPHAMMSSYNRVGTRVSGAKSNLLTDWLRNEAGFNGFVVTDMYQLGSYGSLTFYLGLLSMPTGVFCGNDLVDGSITSAKQFEPYREGYGELAWKMRESAKRILYTVCHSAGMNGVSTTTRMQYQLTWWQTTLITLDAVFGAAALGALGFFAYEFYRRNIKKEDSQAN